MDKAKIKKYLFPVLAALFAIIFIVSAIILIKYFINAKRTGDQYDELANLVQQEQNPAGTDKGNSNESALPAVVEITHPTTGQQIKMLREYATLFQMNPDMAGWIRIEGTKVDYPVMYTPDRGSYYLLRDFYGKNNSHGCIYAYATSDVFTPSDNVTIGGHNMRDDSMFGTLHNYNDPEFCKEHPYIIFDTIYEHHTYKIISVFYTTDFLDTGFAYHWFVNGTEEEFNEFVATAKSLSLYEIEDTAVYGDKLITLSTCEDTLINGRLVIVARKIVK